MRISRSSLRSLLGVAVLLVVLVAIRIGADRLAPRVVANGAELSGQQAAAERGIQRAYIAASDQLHRARALRLPISDAQAAVIEQRNLDDLRSLRHNAFASLGLAFSFSSGDAETYARATEQRMDAAASASPSPAPQVLLAPRLFSIVQRMDDIAAQVADRGTREMTVAPSASPGASPTPSPAPSGSARPTPSPTRSP